MTYLGHFSHGNARGLTERLYTRFAWLAPLTNGRRRFDYRLEGRLVSIRIRSSA